MGGEKLYRKIGSHYKEVGVEWVGFPADGVWYVADGRQSLIMRVGDIPDPMPLAAMQRHRDAAVRSMRDAYEKLIRDTVVKWQDDTLQITFPSLYDLIDVLFKEVAKAEATVKAKPARSYSGARVRRSRK